jgi:DNA-binding response OmpR family regulator
VRILLVEDERKLASAVAQLLKEHHYLVDVAYDGDSGLELAYSDCYDLLILDVMLPKQSGLDIVKSVRQAHMNVPVLLLTARDTIDDKVDGLDAGADDYLGKPFANRELLARIRALTRRMGNVAVVGDVTVDGFTIQLNEHVITREGIPLALTLKEFQLLELLIRNHGKVMSKELILDRVWGPEADIVANAVENYIHFLRKKIDVPGQSSFIDTVRGVGYVFRPKPGRIVNPS